jgi:hypothetical protein
MFKLFGKRLTIVSILLMTPLLNAICTYSCYKPLGNWRKHCAEQTFGQDPIKCTTPNECCSPTWVYCRKDSESPKEASQVPGNLCLKATLDENDKIICIEQGSPPRYV